MYQEYRLNERKLREALAAKGFRNLGMLLRKAALHRNSLNDYIEGRRSVFSSVTRKICDALDCDPLSLVERSDTPLGMDEPAYALKGLLQRLVESRPRISFFLLGSRAKGSNRGLSDWDVAVTGGASKLHVDEYLGVKLELEDGVEDFPYEVDLINFDEAPRWFLLGINYVPKLLAGNEAAFSHALGVIDGARKN